MDQNKIYGIIFGHAIGDSLGLPLEGCNKETIQMQVKGWQFGEWTDDTEQMLCILDSILERGKIEIKDIAKRLYQWAKKGGKGIGRTVAQVICHPSFLDNPYISSKEIWEKSGGYLAPNGGVMRTSILGIWKYWDKEEVIRNAEAVCRITHWDPRCVGSCVAVSYAISAFLRGINDLEIIYKEVEKLVDNYDKRIHPYLELAKGPISGLKLDEPKSMGYTLKTLAAGFWALLNAKDFEGGLITVINEGGDTDTNGAVAGALLGARFGYNSIPKKYISGLLNKDMLEEKIGLLILKLQSFT